MSIVRENLMDIPGYTPYCGADVCRNHWPRTYFYNGQFKCSCGWVSSFDKEFISTYKDKWNKEGLA